MSECTQVYELRKLFPNAEQLAPGLDAVDVVETISVLVENLEALSDGFYANEDVGTVSISNSCDASLNNLWAMISRASRKYASSNSPCLPNEKSFVRAENLSRLQEAERALIRLIVDFQDFFETNTNGQSDAIKKHLNQVKGVERLDRSYIASICTAFRDYALDLIRDVVRGMNLKTMCDFIRLVKTQ